MATNHSATKRNRRPKSKRRKDYTRATMLALRSPEKQQLAAVREAQHQQTFA